MAEEAEKRGRGRPSKYLAEMCETVLDLGEAGKSKAQIARSLGVSRQTVDVWKEEHPEFRDALKEAHDRAQAWWEDKGQDGLTADKFNAVLFIFQMKNRFRDDYRDRPDDLPPDGTLRIIVTGGFPLPDTDTGDNENNRG